MAEVTHVESGEDRIVLTVTVKAAPERVYRALTEAAEIQKWFFPEAETDPRPGGRYKFTWRSQESARDHVREGEFLELVPGQKVSYTWDARPKQELGQPGDGAMPTVVEWRLEPVPGGTRITLAHSGWGEDTAWREMFRFHDEGWEFFVGNLSTVLEDGVDRRVEVMEMRG